MKTTIPPETPTVIINVSIDHALLDPYCDVHLDINGQITIYKADKKKKAKK